MLARDSAPLLGRKRIDMRAKGIVGQGFQRPSKVDRDVVPGRDLIGDFGMGAVPVGRDKGIGV
jgi:hypothetical protein